MPAASRRPPAAAAPARPGPGARRRPGGDRLMSLTVAGSRPSSSARSARTVTFRRPRASANSRSTVAFFPTESTRVHSMSGRAIASGSPGRPPPDPRSIASWVPSRRGWAERPAHLSDAGGPRRRGPSPGSGCGAGLPRAGARRSAARVPGSPPAAWRRWRAPRGAASRVRRAAQGSVGQGTRNMPLRWRFSLPGRRGRLRPAFAIGPARAPDTGTQSRHRGSRTAIPPAPARSRAAVSYPRTTAAWRDLWM